MINDVLSALRTHADDFRRQGVTHMAVFGSVARRAHGAHSDVDIVVDFDPGAHVSLFDLMDLEERAAGILGAPVDLMTRKSLKPRIRERLEREAINVF